MTPVARVPFTDLGAMTRDVRRDVDAAWTALLTDSDFIEGAAVERFERAWAAFCGVGHAVAVGSGTDALSLTLRALGIGHGDEVVVPANTFVATVEAVVLVGATPRFADVDPDTLLLTPDTLAAAITDRTSAVVAVHLYGQTVDMDGIGGAARAAGLAVVEDAAQAHGAVWRGRRAGSFGVAGCFSFYPGKNLGAFGDAGAIVTSDSALATAPAVVAQSRQVPGRTASARRRRHEQPHGHDPGRRADGEAAGIWTGGTRRACAWWRATGRQRRRGPSAVSPSARAPFPRPISPWRSRRIGTPSGPVSPGRASPRPCTTPCPATARSRTAGTRDRPLPVVEAAADQILSLPLFPHMTGAQVDHVCGALRRLKAVVGIAR